LGFEKGGDDIPLTKKAKHVTPYIGSGDVKRHGAVYKGSGKSIGVSNFNVDQFVQAN